MTLRVKKENSKLVASFTEQVTLTEPASRGNRFYEMLEQYESSFKPILISKEAEDDINKFEAIKRGELLEFNNYECAYKFEINRTDSTGEFILYLQPDFLPSSEIPKI